MDAMKSARSPLDLDNPLDLTRLIRPRSIAVVGVSATPGAIGNVVLTNLERFGYGGEIYLVSRGRTEVIGRPCVGTIDELPVGIDTVVLGIPDHAVLDAVRACARRGVGAVVVFAAGFAEAGDEGTAAQLEMRRIACESGMLVVGPNCLGLTNFVQGIPLTFGPATISTCGDEPTIAVLAQSGGMMGNQRLTHFARGVKLSYAISTGNEAVVGVEDFLGFLIDDAHTSVISMFVEQVRRPALFLRLLDRAKEIGKPVVLLHLGRSQGARESAASHTGALAGDFEVMSTLVRSCGVVMVDTMEELADVSWLLKRFTQPPAGGVGVMTDSGAFKGFALDFAESIGLPLPNLADRTIDELKKILPTFSTASNPLDMTAQGLREMELYGNAAREMLKDPGLGALSIVLMPGSPQTGLAKFKALQSVIESSDKAVTYTMMGGDSALADELVEEIRRSGLPFFRSPERALRALKHVTAYGLQRNLVRRRTAVSYHAIALAGAGVLAEYDGKRWLSDLGLALPQGGLARDLAEAIAVADRIGYPLVLKAQSPQLPHKSDVGGVIVNIRNRENLEQGWSRLYANVAAARPDLRLDGVLVEAMAAPGVVEMVVGAKRDPQWGPVLMVGLGGVWIEVLKDVRLLPADLTEAAIREELLKLRAAALLQGARGKPPADIEALASAVGKLGAAFCANPRLLELDINPLVVYPEGQGVLALDALLVLADD